MKKSAYIIVCIFVAMLLGSCSVARQLKKADRMFDSGEYFAAGDVYKRTQGRISTQKQKKLKAEVCFKLAECYRLNGNHQRAAKSYAQAIKYKYPDTIAYLQHARSLHALGRYAEAAKNYEIYLQAFPNDFSAKSGLEGAKNAAEWKKIPSRYVVKLASEFNSKKFSDFSPAFMGNESSAVVFTSNRDSETSRKVNAITGVPNNDLFSSRRNASGKWEKPSPLEGEFNTDDDEGTVAFSSDGKTIFFTRCRLDPKGDIGAEIWTAKRSGGQWTAPQKIVLFKDSTISCAHPTLSANGERLYFVSDAQGGFGGKDIWFSDLVDGAWSLPENMGEKINTSGNEMFPCARNDSAFYFSSDGHAGFGGLDIFVAKRDSTGQFLIQNLGAPINSNSDDFGITFAAEGESGFFSSNRNQSKAIDKIYSFVLPELEYAVEGKIADEKGNSLPDVIVKLVGDNGTNVKIRAKKDGSYRIKLDRNANYIMLASKRGYLNSSAKLSTENLSDSKTFEQKFVLPTIGQPIPIDNIFFEFGKAELTAESEKALLGTVKMMNDNPNIAIEVAAHTDCVGTDESNLELSHRRAQAVVDFLIAAGIDEKRLASKGFGESQPVEVDEALGKQHNFLRKGELLDEKLVKLLTPEQQEVVNAINRRTEFRVTKTTYNIY